MTGINYRREIDGLRAFAVIPVILFHSGLSFVQGGFIGVDVFFVISGFLITSIIKKELDQGNFSFRNFWARRVRRIVPAMVFVTAATLGVAYFFVFWPDQQAIGKQALAALLSVANIYLWRNSGDYWGKEAEESPFLHTWSLSVEEQFYLFFPVAMWLIFRFRPRWLKGCILTATLGSLALFFWGLSNYPAATFYLLPTRVWELGTGCLLAVSLSNQSPRTSNFGVFAIVGLGMVVASYLFVDKLDGGVGLAVVGTALIIAFGQTGLCNKLLSQRWAVHIGKLSYSLYLWHWPVLVLAKSTGMVWPGISGNVLLLLVIYLLSLVTYHLVEKPTRRKNGIVPVILVCGTITAMAALWLASSLRLYDTSRFDQPYFINYDCNPSIKQTSGRLRGSAKFAMTIVEYRGFKPGAYSQEGIRVGDESIDPAIVVLGDSHGCMWSDAIATVVKERDLPITFFCMNGETPFFDWLNLSGQAGYSLSRENKLSYDKARISCLKKWKPKLVIISAFWSVSNEEKASAVIEFLGQQGAKVLLIEDPPILKCGDKNVMQLLAEQGINPSGAKAHFWPHRTSFDKIGRQLVQKLATRHDHVELLPTYDLYTSKSGALVLAGKSAIYLDDDHLLQAGANMIIPRLREKVSEIMGER